MKPRSWFLFLAFLLVAATGLAEGPNISGRRFIGNWEGPANVYDDHHVMTPTKARLSIFPSTVDSRFYIVEMKWMSNKMSRFTRCTLISEGELRVRDQVRVNLDTIHVDGVLRSRDGTRIEEGHIGFFVRTPEGEDRPYSSIKLAASRVSPATPTPEPAATPAAEQ